MYQKNKYVLSTIVLLASIMVLSVLALYMIGRTQHSDYMVLNPKGMIALQERDLIYDATKLMLIVVIPVFAFTFAFVWKYRGNNTEASYSPDLEGHTKAELLWWGVPFAIILVLAVLTWKRTYELDPFKPIDSTVQPIKIQVVALDWKWLFLYPEEKIATVNYIHFPENTPLDFEITADAPMNSLWIPHLGGQMYAMPGMKSQLHLIADAPGTFYGSSANLSGKGFAEMRFLAQASSKEEYDSWVESVKTSGEDLTREHYLELTKPSVKHPTKYYVLRDEELFNWIVMKYMMPMPVGDSDTAQNDN